jgi:hypothetical protein
MKRDADLVRDILLSVEAGHAGIQSEITEDQDIINHHLHLMIDGGLLSGQEINEGQWRVYGLTWEGCELIDLIRDGVRWAAIKQKLNGKSCSFDIIKRIARKLIE